MFYPFKESKPKTTFKESIKNIFKKYNFLKSKIPQLPQSYRLDYSETGTCPVGVGRPSDACREAAELTPKENWT